MTDSFIDHYQLSLLAGVVGVARDAGLRLLAFGGRVLEPDEPPASLLGPQSVDGLVVTALTMAYRVGVEGLAAYVKGLGAFPVCFVGCEYPGVSAVLCDNQGGMAQGVRHLISVHGASRVAFIQGTAGNAEAEERFQAYCAALAEARIPFDQQLVKVGNFSRLGGEQAMLELLDSVYQPDSVVAANDMMALGAMDALQARGLRIPTDVRVLGFDDMEESRFSLPPLTSVRQPLEQLGREATRRVRDAMDGAGASTTSLNLELMLRASCGCGSGSAGLNRAKPSDRSGDFEAAFIRRRSITLAETTRAAQGVLGRLGTDWTERLVQALTDQIVARKPDAFSTVLSDLVTRSRRTGGELGLYHRVLTVLRIEARLAAGADASLLESIEDLMHEARESVSTALQHDQALRRWAVTGWANALHDASVVLGRVRRLDDLGPMLPEQLLRLGFRRAYIALHEADSQFSRLIFGWERDRPLERGASVRFRTKALVPPGFIPDDEGGSWVVLPLMAGKRRFGHLVLDFGPGVGVVWETLCQHLSLTLELCGVVPNTLA